MPGSTDTLDALYRRHAPGVFRRARRLLGAEAEAHEIVQDVFLSLFERPEQFAGKSAFTTFLYSATTHACLNRIRNQKTRLRLVEAHTRGADEADRAMTPEERSMLHGLLARMPEDLARVAVYHYVDDLTHDDISRIIGCSRRQVGNLLERLAEWGRAEDRTPC